MRVREKTRKNTTDRFSHTFRSKKPEMALKVTHPLPKLWRKCSNFEPHQVCISVNRL